MTHITTRKTAHECWDMLRDGKRIGEVSRDSRDKQLYARLDNLYWDGFGEKLQAERGFLFKCFKSGTALYSICAELAVLLDRYERENRD